MTFPKPENTYIALLHYPVYNKQHEVITSAITNLDIHDVARVVRTYGLAGYYLVNPTKSQFKLLQETIAFWQTGLGREYNPTRSQSFGDVIAVQHPAAIRRTVGKEALWVITTAKRRENCVKLADLSEICEKTPQRKVVLVFGTGYGLTDEFIDSYEHVLCPLEAGTGYNHLSVRSAISILVDRMFGH